MAQKLTATSLANEAHSKLCSVQKNFCLQPTENSLRYPGSRGFIFVLIANLCFEESTQNISLLLPANVFVSVFFSKEEKMFSATSLTGNWILISLNIPTGPLSGAKKTLTAEIWNVASISSSKWDAIISPSKRSQLVRWNQINNAQCLTGSDKGILREMNEKIFCSNSLQTGYHSFSRRKMEQRNLKGEVVCNLIFSAAAFKRRHYTEIFQRDFYNIVIIRFSLFIYLFIYNFFSNSETIMKFTLSNIIGSTVDPRPQDDVLPKNVTVILLYQGVSPLDCKLIYNCDEKNYL